MNQDRLRKLDFNLLMIFRAVMKHRQLTAAAEELGLTQSAISHALKRLRGIVGTDIFERRQFGVEPTEAAHRLVGPVETILSTAEAALAPPVASARPRPRAGKKRQGVAIAIAPASLAGLAPDLLLLLDGDGPSSPDFVPTSPTAALSGLAAGRYDLALGTFEDVADGIAVTPLSNLFFSIAVAKRHPKLKKKLSLKKYLAQDHISVADADAGIDASLAAIGKARRMGPAAADYHAALTMAADTAALATVPAAIARRWTKPLKLRLFEPPVKIPPVRLALARHQSSADDARLDAIADILARFGVAAPE